MIVVLFHLGIVVATTSTHRSSIPPGTHHSDSHLFGQYESNTPRPSNKAVTSRSPTSVGRTRHLIRMLGCCSRSWVRTDDKTGHCSQDSDGDAQRISLEHVSTPNNW